MTNSISLKVLNDGERIGDIIDEKTFDRFLVVYNHLYGLPVCRAAIE